MDQIIYITMVTIPYHVNFQDICEVFVRYISIISMNNAYVIYSIIHINKQQRTLWKLIRKLNVLGVVRVFLWRTCNNLLPINEGKSI
jgi:hypothetical protein